MRFRPLVIGWFVLWALAGCAGLGTHRESPHVSVSAIRIVEATLLEQVYAVTVRVQNRSERKLSIRGGSFDLSLNGKDFGSGVTDQQVSVTPYSDAKVEVQMVSTVFGWVRLIQDLQARQGQSLVYEISGRFSVDGGLGAVSFRDVGEIELPRATPADRLPEENLGS